MRGATGASGSLPYGAASRVFARKSLREALGNGQQATGRRLHRNIGKSKSLSARDVLPHNGAAPALRLAGGRFRSTQLGARKPSFDLNERTSQPAVVAGHRDGHDLRILAPLGMRQPDVRPRRVCRVQQRRRKRHPDRAGEPIRQRVPLPELVRPASGGCRTPL